MAPTSTQFLANAHQAIGDPYQFGAAGPNAFDCSGLVQWAAEKAGLRNVPRTSEEQWQWVQHISPSELQPGDLIFEQWPGDQASPGHVVIWLGSGKIEQAPSTGQLVQTDTFSPQAVTAAGGQVVGYGRIPGLSYSGQPATLTSASSGPGGIIGEILPAFGLGIPFLEGAGQTVGDVGTAIADLTNVIGTFEHWLSWLFVPSHWIRIICFVLGAPLVGVGILTMVTGSRPIPVSVGPVGTEVSGGSVAPALGIAEVTAGAVLLFIAFHNLPASVQTFPQLLSHVQSQVQGGSTPAPAPRPAVA